MAGMPKMQEQFPADRHGWRECRKCRSNFRLTAMDGGLSRQSMAFAALGLLPGGDAENAEAIFG
jgi:hypothetical protein